MYRAALCVAHEDVPNCSQGLLDWLKKNKVSTSVFVVSSVKRGEDKRKKSNYHNRMVMSDSQLRDRLARELNVEEVDDYIIKPIPQGEAVFEFAVLRGKN